MKTRIYFFTLLGFLLPIASLYAAPLEHDLFFGLKNNPEIKQLQEFLRDEGLYSGPVNGNFFNLTRSAVKKFQEREKIVPVAGFFGPLTRSRANILLSKKHDQIVQTAAEALRTQIEALQRQLKVLLDQQTKAVATTTSASSTAQIQPPGLVFTKSPEVAEAGFVSDSPLGVRYPYRVLLAWSMNKTGSFSEAITCTPDLKFKAASPGHPQLFPNPDKQYSCEVAVSDSDGNRATGTVAFRSPTWFSVSGTNQQKFPDTAANPLYLGATSLFNGTSTDILLSQIVIDTTDSMNSPLNRGKQAYLILRNGTTTADEVISRTAFTFSSVVPTDHSNRGQIQASVPILISQGTERTIGFWLESFDLVLGGSLSFELNSFLATTPLPIVGSSRFTLTK